MENIYHNKSVNEYAFISKCRKYVMLFDCSKDAIQAYDTHYNKLFKGAFVECSEFPEDIKNVIDSYIKVNS